MRRPSFPIEPLRPDVQSIILAETPLIFFRISPPNFTQEVQTMLRRPSFSVESLRRYVYKKYDFA